MMLKPAAVVVVVAEGRGRVLWGCGVRVQDGGRGRGARGQGRVGWGKLDCGGAWGSSRVWTCVCMPRHLPCMGRDAAGISINNAHASCCQAVAARHTCMRPKAMCVSLRTPPLVRARSGSRTGVQTHQRGRSS